MKIFHAIAACTVLLCLNLSAQTPCSGSKVAGIVRDSTGAIIPGASVTLDGGETTQSGDAGQFHFSCVASGQHDLRVSETSFAPKELNIHVPQPKAELVVILQPEDVTTSVNVGEDSGNEVDAAANGTSQTISGDQLSTLADDPDDLKRELQQLAATSGGLAANTTITVDGFQSSSPLPPKSSIAYIKVNPDLFSAEYRQPPFDGGRVEVYTRPGQSAFHGALFTTNGSPWENARDPFSTSRAALGKQRYGFELNGPVRKKGSDFALTLEHRTIDDYAVVNAITLDDQGNQQSTIANVAAPQQLWLATARLGWQLNEKNTFTTSYNGNVNHSQNVGVGGTSLPETGYSSGTYDHTLRLLNVTTVSPKLMHEARVAFDWTGETDVPSATTPQVQVAGAFTSGGASIGQQRLHTFEIEADDDAILSTAKHLLKFGTQFKMYNVSDQLTTNFNGVYTFGGGSAPVLDANGNPIPGQTEIISGLEQYRRAKLGLAGGTPTAYNNVTGTPQVSFTQIRDSLYIQDMWKVRPKLQIAMGFRYYLQTAPLTMNGATPRLGIAWSPDKKEKWQLHAHVGLFTGQYGTSDYQELQREDGVHRITSTVYNPIYNDPFDGATIIHSVRQASPHLQNITFAIENVGGTHTFPHGWSVNTDVYWGRIWNYTRTLNINSPLNDNPTGPRPSTPNLNILQTNNSGQGRANVEFFGINQHELKHLNFFFGAVRVDLIDNTNDDTFFNPQSSRTDAGEFAPRNGQGRWQIFGNGMLKLPEKFELSTNLQAQSGVPYNITTGFDNNGDGNFNDRPQYAPTGDPDAIPTQFGLLVPSGGIGAFPRNAGRTPWTVHMDTNIERKLQLNNPKAEHPQTLTFNVRSSNVLNHLNVTSVGGVLGSPLFNRPYAADNGRRIEAGVRYSF
ncbi:MULTISPECIES: TonB-dependent receptor [Acidobacteriaceae]|uniref:TonB-dependent receptor n=1 Tax=Acidobacteriaceae TaxID=204434 RepID=UPI00131D8D53|nr:MULTISPECIES: TonB-dependent receptor [Acidobacteriaceae]MDW5267619.1 TonB-dependent receptor [Edaphobacter sp.]